MLKILNAKHSVGRAIVEIAFIIFLFYTNLLMGEYTQTNYLHKTLWRGLIDVFTYKNFGIAVFGATVGFVIFEYLRDKS
jgi:hypothetical protein